MDPKYMKPAVLLVLGFLVYVCGWLLVVVGGGPSLVTNVDFAFATIIEVLGFVLLVKATRAPPTKAVSK
jgi:hypothetical protein